jgi:hypothetical protein
MQTRSSNKPASATPAPEPVSRRRLLPIRGGGAAGGIIAGGIAAAIIGRQPSQTDTWQLETVPTTALSQVETTLAPDQAARLMEEARRCRDPLARVAIWHSPNMPGGVVSITSGAYRSPRFALTGTPTLIAIPFPAPYASGRGFLAITGEAKDFAISLQPVNISSELKETLLISVHWTPVGGCT